MRVRVESLGCRLNIGEMESLARAFARAGHRVVGPGEAVDLIVLNTCAVTHLAARKSRKLLRHLRRTWPQARLVATGCYATLQPARAAALGIDLVVANDAKDRLPQVLAARGLLRSADAVPPPEAAPIDPVPGGRTRAFLKVQDGCDNRCTFCIVTTARGAGRSRPAAAVLDEIRLLVAAGYREVVLTGVHLGSYGRDLGCRRGLAELVARILGETDLSRLRLSSLEPWDVEPSLFELWRDRRLLPHLHLPLQSGCDATLRRMARRTDQRSFTALVESARAAIPDLAISTDVIVGFPGESEAEFEESIRFIERIGFSRLHVFRYSARAGTAAAGMAGRVDPDTVRRRAGRMHALGERLEQAFRRGWLGRRTEVLFESAEPTDAGLSWSGLNGSYLRVVVETPADVDWSNRVVPVRIVGERPGAAVGVAAVTTSVAPAVPAPVELTGATT